SPTQLKEDRWVAAAEWKIDKRNVVHHMNAFIRPEGSSYVKEAPVGKLYVASREERAARRDDEREVDRRQLLVGYEPGYRPIPWGPTRAKLLPAGSDIVLEIHYNPNGVDVTDYSELGLYFAKEPPAERVLTISPADSKFTIPPFDPAYRSVTGATLTSDVKLISLQPHMHLRGKSYEIAVKYPDGRREVLLNVPKYDFNWQTTYFLKEPRVLPKGSQLECIAVFDNSRNNKWNPDPSVPVQWGDQSWEEMNIGFTEIAIDAKRDPEVAQLHGTTRAAPGGRR
ncbi:MAG TPA: thiol-disulfide isomerase, partial [Bryobacteraceae bacterium]|nr:thiol-disulfide isomerase [Bryobacteraceae bacterium]